MPTRSRLSVVTACLEVQMLQISIVISRASEPEESTGDVSSRTVIRII